MHGFGKGFPFRVPKEGKEYHHGESKKGHPLFLETLARAEQELPEGVPKQEHKERQDIIPWGSLVSGTKATVSMACEVKAEQCMSIASEQNRVPYPTTGSPIDLPYGWRPYEGGPVLVKMASNLGPVGSEKLKDEMMGLSRDRARQ